MQTRSNNNREQPFIRTLSRDCPCQYKKEVANLIEGNFTVGGEIIRVRNLPLLYSKRKTTTQR